MSLVSVKSKRSIKLGIKEVGMSGGVNSENKSKSSENGEPKKGGNTFLERAKSYMPAWEMPTLKAAIDAGAKVATGVLAAQVAFSGINRAEGFSTHEASDTALALGGGKELTDRPSSSLVASDQRAKFIGKSPTEPYVPVPQQEWVYKGQSTKELWPDAYDKYVGNEGLHQGEAQGKDERETVLDFRSRKVTPGEKTSRSVTDAHPDQLKQDKSERAESSEKKETTWQDLNKMLNTEEMREGIKKLMQNKTAIEIIDKAINNEKFMAGTKEIMGKDKAVQGLKELMQIEGFKDMAMSQLKDEAGVRRALSSVANGTLTDACVSWYRGYRDFFSYQGCCRDQGGIPHCDGNFKVDQKHVGIVVGSLVAAGVLCCCCAVCCCSKDEACAKGCFELGADCCNAACCIGAVAEMCGGS
jgi:hypothetical protein